MIKRRTRKINDKGGLTDILKHYKMQSNIDVSVKLDYGVCQERLGGTLTRTP